MSHDIFNHIGYVVMCVDVLLLGISNNFVCIMISIHQKYLWLCLYHWFDWLRSRYKLLSLNYRFDNLHRLSIFVISRLFFEVFISVNSPYARIRLKGMFVIALRGYIRGFGPKTTHFSLLLLSLSHKDRFCPPSLELGSLSLSINPILPTFFLV